MSEVRETDVCGTLSVPRSWAYTGSILLIVSVALQLRTLLCQWPVRSSS